MVGWHACDDGVIVVVMHLTSLVVCVNGMVVRFNWGVGLGSANATQQLCCVASEVVVVVAVAGWW